MSPLDYQELAARTEKLLDQKGRLQHALLGLTSEAGEIADTIKKYVIYSQPLDHENIQEEIGDLLWYVALLANACQLDLEVCMIENIRKLRKRYPASYSDQHAAERLDKQEG